MQSQIIHLSDQKVLKLTNGYGHLGLIIPGATVRVTVGVRYSLPKDKHVPDDNVTVRPRYELVRLGKNKYEMWCSERFKERVILHLIDKCGLSDEAPKKRKPKRRMKQRVHQASYMKFGLR